MARLGCARQVVARCVAERDRERALAEASSHISCGLGAGPAPGPRGSSGWGAGCWGFAEVWNSYCNLQTSKKHEKKPFKNLRDT